MRLRGRLAFFVAAGLLGILASSAVAQGQGCSISLKVGTQQVSYPSDSIPPPSSTNFGQIFDVNYSSTMDNSTMVLQYLNGSNWGTLGDFPGNPVGFTEITLGIANSWVHFGTNSVRVQSGGCSSNVSTFNVNYDPTATEVDFAVYAALAAIILGFIIVGKKLGWKRFIPLAALVYIVVAPWTGQRYDVYFLLSSGIRVLQHVNPFDPGTPPLYPGPLKWAYPPLFVLYSAFTFLVYQVLTGSALPTVTGLTWSGWLTSTYNVYQAFVPSSLPVLVLLLKLPMVASAFLTGILLKRMTGAASAGVWWLANPLVIVVAAIWGQLDPIATGLAVASLYYFGKGRHDRAYLLASFGAAVKVWPALLIPLMFLVTVRKEGLRSLKPLLWCLPALLITIGLYAAYGSLVNSLFVFLYARGIPTFAGAFTVNGLTWQEVLFVLNSPPLPVFLIVAIPAYVICYAWIYFKKETDVTKWLIVSILIFFLTYNYVNPQYFYWIVPLFLLQRRKLMASIFTILPLIYVMLSYNAFYFVSPALLPDLFALGASVADQLKVNFFYQTSSLFLLVSAAVPTIAYVWSLLSEVRAARYSEGPLPRTFNSEKEDSSPIAY